jgi:hypothetical protein
VHLICLSYLRGDKLGLAGALWVSQQVILILT